jgi:peptide/nickel transport system substrate-binding protein
MKKLRKVLVLAIFLSFLLVGFTSPVLAKEALLNIAVAHPWPTLDPMAWSTAATGLNQVYENLFRFKPGTLEVEPWLAESYEVSPDKRTYTFRLRKGVKFHDGTPFNAKAVAFSVDRAMALKQTGSMWLQPVEKVEVVDDYTVRFVLKSPLAIFLFHLAHPSVLRMVSPTAVKAHEKDGDWAKTWLDLNDAGSGPYVIRKAVKNDYIHLERFINYWKGWGTKYLDAVLFKEVRESSSRKMMLLNKQVHFAQDVSFEDIDELKKVPYINVELRSLPATVVLVLRFTGGADNPIRNLKIREAIACSIDYDAMIKAAMKGFANQAQGPVPRLHFGHNDKLKIYKRDVNKAKELLKEAGYKPGEIKMIIMYNVGYDWKRLASETLMSNLGEIGINLELYTTTWTGMAASLRNGTAPPPPHMYIHFSSGTVDALTLLRRMYASSSIGTWNPGYSNPELDRVLEEAQMAPGLAKYKEFIFKAQEIWEKDIFTIPLWDFVNPYTMLKSVKGFVPSFDKEDYNLYDMYLEE